MKTIENHIAEDLQKKIRDKIKSLMPNYLTHHSFLDNSSTFSFSNFIVDKEEINEFFERNSRSKSNLILSEFFDFLIEMVVQEMVKRLYEDAVEDFYKSMKDKKEG